MDKEVLIWNAIYNLPLEEAPRQTKRYGNWFVFTIGVGNDHSIDITMDEDTYYTLKKRSIGEPQ